MKLHKIHTLKALYVYKVDLNLGRYLALVLNGVELDFWFSIQVSFEKRA